ncbi:MAG: NAD-dependent epimerase/dehydratase family protein [Tabrizicola sp.]|jgi:nucleoside-diphosphate-sugar epimerase|nr:NAD-dependent epimerase/dehydratase family protein [Tabrizicola sp.]
MRVTITGAGGFLGGRLAHVLAADARVTALRLVDHAGLPDLPGAERLIGDLCAPDLRAWAIEGADAVIHLAAIPGGAAEADPALAQRVNLDATMGLMQALRGSKVRFVFASTVAVLGDALPDVVTDETPPAPTLLYGAQKAMVEVLLATYARRGWLDGVALRPAGIVARGGADAGLKTAFLSRVFHALKRGEDVTLPVAPDGTTWLASVGVVARNFAHAALIPDLGARRVLTLPALCLRFDALVAALRAEYPDSPARVSYAPDPAIMAAFGCHPPLLTPAADALGLRRDADARALVRAAF